MNIQVNTNAVSPNRTRSEETVPVGVTFPKGLKRLLDLAIGGERPVAR